MSADGEGARWCTWMEAVGIMRRADRALTEPAAMMRLSRWSRPDATGAIVVRAQGTRGDRRYLHADLVGALASSAT